MKKISNDKIALITGAYRGLGLETARMLLKKGFGVILTARNKVKGQAAAERLSRETGGKVWALELDVTKDESLDLAALEVATIVDHVDVLINNAAVFPDPSKGPLDTSRVMLLDAFDTNTAGALRASLVFLPFLEKSHAARIVNVSSGLGALGEMQSMGTAYSLSKTALNAVTRQLASALGSKNILVNSVCPGWCRTELGGPQAPRSVEQGAEGIVWLATDAPADLNGSFVRDHQVISW